jgi:hypothetical protein
MRPVTDYYKLDTSKLNREFNISPKYDTVLEETYEALQTECVFSGGMTGLKHSEETKKKMSISAPKKRPHLHVGGKIIKDDIIYEYTCLRDACKELGLSSGHLSEMMNGKRKSVKGWRKYA